MSFLLIAGREAAEEPLTIALKRDCEPRGNVSIVLPVKGVWWCQLPCPLSRAVHSPLARAFERVK